MNSHQGLQPPSISYVGRLSDSRKGLELFIDALEILWSESCVPDFQGWVIGGSKEDVNWATHLIASRPLLRERMVHNNLILWGRIEREALSEFYSRATVLVIPSFREQFGIVAVEAMMCGCPVVASATGGLQDLVLDSITGTLFDRGNPSALAAVLASYVRNPTRAKWKGTNARRWARAHFKAGEVYSQYVTLLENPEAFPGAEEDNWITRYRQDEIARTIPVVEHLLGSKVVDSWDLSSSPSLSFGVKTGTGKAFVKMHAPRPTSMSCLYDIPHSTTGEHLPWARLSLLKRLEGFGITPRLLGCDMALGISVQEWCEPMEKITEEELPQTMVQIADRLANLLPLSDETGTAYFEESLKAFGTMDTEEAIRRFDIAAAEVNASLFDGQVRTRKVHPQIELMRLRYYLEEHSGLLPRSFVSRAKGVVEFLLDMAPVAVVRPTFAHGTLKVEHVMKYQGGRVVCDVDHAGYHCGPIDKAHWAWEHCKGKQNPSPKAAMALLKSQSISGAELHLGACWVAVFELNRALWRLASGKWQKQAASMGFLYGFCEAYRLVISSTH